MNQGKVFATNGEENQENQANPPINPTTTMNVNGSNGEANVVGGIGRESGRGGMM